MINNKRTKGFTLAEVLVSIAIFSLLSIVLANIFVSAVKSQGRILLNQTLMEQSNYSLEYMGKILRMATNDADGGCTGTANTNYGVVGGNSIFFIAYDTIAAGYRCREFLLENDAIKEKKSSNDNAASFGSAAALTSSKVKVANLTFILAENSTIQPKVTIGIRLEGVNSSSSGPTMTIQTSISQRQLNTD